MADFLTSFATGGLKAATQNMNRIVQERGEVLDTLRPVVQEKFSLLNNNTKKYADIYKKVSKFDGGQTAFNYFFDRGDIDTSLSIDEAAKMIMDNASQIPQDYIAGNSISGEERISQVYQSGLDTINNYITDVSTKHKLGNSTSDLFLKEGNPALAGATPVDVLEQQLKVPVEKIGYAPGIMGGSIEDKKTDLLARAAAINVYLLNNEGRAANQQDLMDNELADKAGTYAIQPTEIDLYNDAVNKKDIKRDILIESFKAYASNEAFLSNFKTDPNLSDEQNLVNQLNQYVNVIDNVLQPFIDPAGAGVAGGGDMADPVIVDLMIRLENAEEGSQEYIDIANEFGNYINSQ